MNFLPPFLTPQGILQNNPLSFSNPYQTLQDLPCCLMRFSPESIRELRPTCERLAVKGNDAFAIRLLSSSSDYPFFHLIICY